MDALQKILQQALERLRTLTISQRAAIFLGAALIAVAVGWLTQWAAQPDMTALMPQNLTAEEIANISSGLDTMNVQHKTVGQQVMVRADANKAALIAQLHQMDRMPSDTSVSFESLIKDSNPWISEGDNERRWTVALQLELQRIIGQLNSVKSARVLLNLHSRRGFTRETPPATASVTLVMQGGSSVSRQLARAAANIVAGAVRGLSAKNVQVVDSNGVSVLEGETDDPGSSSAIALQRREHERAIAEKIRSQLAFDPRVRVNVQVELDLTTRSTETTTPTEAVDIFEDRKTESSTKTRPSGQPGVQPNVGLSAGGAGRDENQTTESSKTERVAGNKRTTESKPSGEITTVFAAVNVSSSYLASVFRRDNAAADKVTSEQLQQVFDKEKPRILSQVAVLVKPAAEEQVRVDWYYDQGEEAAAAVAASAGVDSVLDLAKQYGPHAGLGLLAIFSLGLMLRLSKRASTVESIGLELGLPKEAIEAAKQAARDVEGVTVTSGGRAVSKVAAAAAAIEESLPQFEAAQPVARAAGTDGVLEAREVDERTIQIGKMVDQLGDMITADKEAVASVLEQWIRRSD